MKDIRSHRLLYFKGFLFLLMGVLAAGLVWIELPSLKIAALLALAIWSFCRAYYFAFYVIQHYIDPSFRFAGLWDFAMYVMRGRRQDKADEN